MTFSRRSVNKLLGASAAATLFMPYVARGADNGVVNLIGSESYMPEAFLQRFQSETGITVNQHKNDDAQSVMNYVTAEGEERLTDLVVVPTHRTWGFVATGVLEPIDEQRLPGLARLQPSIVNAEAQLIGGTRYGVPIAAGCEVLAYRDGAIDDADAATWNCLFNEKYAGRTSMGAGAIVLLGLHMAGLKDRWNAFSGDPAESDKLEELLKEVQSYILPRKKNLRKWHTSGAEMVQLFMTNEIDASQATSEQAARLTSAEPAFKKIVPTNDGTYGWTMNLHLLRGAANADNAYTFMNAFLNDPELPGELMRSAGGIPVFSTGVPQEDLDRYGLTTDQVERIDWLFSSRTDDPRFALMDKYVLLIRDA